MLPAGGRNADQKSHLAGGQNPERKKLLWKVFGKAMLFFGLLNLVENMEQTTPARAVIQSLGATAGILLSALCIPEATACEPVGEDGGKKGPVTVGGGKYQAQDAEYPPGS